MAYSTDDEYWTPKILRPNFTWPCPIRSPVSTTTPPLPRISSPFMRLIWGFVHRRLYDFAVWYCRFWKISSNGEGVTPLPFGLVLKWSNRTSLNEAIATQMARSAGIPAPKVLCYGDHPGNFRRFSILMTRLPGRDLNNSRAEFLAENEQPLYGELEECVRAMRQWKSPFPEGTVCSVIGGPIRSVRVPDHIMGPFDSEVELLDFLFAPSTGHYLFDPETYKETTERARKLYGMKHRMVFTHGDLKAHNVMYTPDFHLAGLIDWESAGWCPEFWDYTTAMRWGEGSWWYQAMAWMSKNQYASELDADIALNNMTVGSYVGFV